MNRPIMDPLHMRDDTPAAKPRQRAKWLRALGRVLLSGVKMLFTAPWGRRRNFRNEDGSPLVRFMRALIYRLALVPVLLVLFLTALVIAATHPGRPTGGGADPLAFGVYYDLVSFLSEDGVRLEGWLAPAFDAKKVLEDKEGALHNKQPAVILVHDFASSKQQLLPMVRPLHDRGFVVLVIGLRGNGSLGGTAQTFGLNESMDVRAAVDMLKRRAYVDPNKIAVVGVGTGANAALLATKKDGSIAALVLSEPIDGFDAAFARRVGQDRTWLPPLRTLFRYTFQVMYRVDTGDLELASYKDVIKAKPVLMLDAKRDLVQPSTVRGIEKFLATRMNIGEATVAGAH